MLKVIPQNVWNNVKHEKCGEIYYQSSKHFSIVCTVCELKTFNYDDFLRHFQNLHLENDTQTDEEAIEVTQFLQETFKVEKDVLDNEEELERSSTADFENTGQTENDEQETELRLMNWDDNDTKTGILKDERHQDENDNEDFSSDDENDATYLPPLKQQLKLNKGKSTKEFKCDVCDKVYKSSQNLSMHIKKGHGNTTKPDNKLTCEDCGLEFPKLRSLEEHCVAEHGGMQCSFCDKRCTSRTNLQRHAEKHTHGNERTFQCDIGECEKRFFTRRQWLAHKRTHTKSKNYVCDVCGYCCREPETLKVHYRTHTGERPFACKVCGKRFVSTSAVKEHSASHIQDRPHVCKVCGHSFARSKSLYHHSFLHLSEKKFKCKICGNAYAQLAGLAGHMRKHREEGFCSGIN